MRQNRIQTRLTKLIFWLLVSIVLAACGRPSEPTKPTVKITSIEEGSQVDVGQDVPVAFEAADIKGVAQVELTINGAPTYVEAANPPVNVFSGSYRWRPNEAGSYLIQVITFNIDGVASDPDQVAVTVNERLVAPPTPTIVPVQPTPTEIVPTETPTPVVIPTTADQPTPTREPDVKPMVVAKVGLNIRAGPSTSSPVIGRLAQGQAAEITGRDEFSAWWQIIFITDGGDRGWVAANTEFSTASNAGAVPVVGASTQSGAAPAPAAEKPTIFRFTADRNTIAVGEKVILSWDLGNAKEAFLRYNGVEEGVVAPGTKTVSPNRDITYQLVARNDAGETTADLSINVTGSTATPAPVLRDGKTALTGGQSIDFDQGLVYGEDAAGADFFWDFQQRQIRPRNGATGTLFSQSYPDITPVDCRAASYGAPITGVDGSNSTQGCYITSEGRYGKFAVVDWDISGRVTINWLTWEN